jgi:hypothetical protein
LGPEQRRCERMAARVGSERTLAVLVAESSPSGVMGL